jgi:hypothetical protein
MLEKLQSFDRNTELLKSFVYPNLSGINIVKGCGTRPCRMCSENSSVYQSSMDLEVVERIFSTYEGNGLLSLFGEGDPVYYRDGNHRIKTYLL